MTIKYVRTKGGKAWVQVGERNEAEWDELLKTAGGLQGRHIGELPGRAR